ncbi:hypothetical protein [Dishui Lake phycodnavirus 2]|nr:hypothetical protein [Dishui Lake phycodnavirus 2]
MKPLSQKVIAKMDKRELAKYEKLRKEWIKTGDEMEKVQADAVIYGRKLPNKPTKAQLAKEQKLINAGFRAEYFAFKKADEYHAFKVAMTKKYA